MGTSTSVIVICEMNDCSGEEILDSLVFCSSLSYTVPDKSLQSSISCLSLVIMPSFVSFDELRFLLTQFIYDELLFVRINFISFSLSPGPLSLLLLTVFTCTVYVIFCEVFFPAFLVIRSSFCPVFQSCPPKLFASFFYPVEQFLLQLPPVYLR